MDPAVEQILMARILQEKEEKPSLSDAMLGGSALGATAGTILGSVPHSVGRGLNAAKDKLAGMSGLTPVTRNRFLPGYRMAGGLVGAVMGGGLGGALREEAIKNSPAAAILAKAQSKGELSEFDKAALEVVLRDTYTQMGLM